MKKPKRNSPKSSRLSLEQGAELLKLAKEAVLSEFSGKELKVSDEIKEKCSKEQGCFVTITKHGELRGCIGFPEPVYPLWKAVIEAARAAAFNDPRFPPLSKEELSEVRFELSVLTVPELIEVSKPEEYLEKIVIGEDGLIIRGYFGSGLLLPQVFTEYNCTPEMALEMTCQKAMLAPGSWRDLSNKVYKFQAQIFSEENGKVVEKKLKT